MRRPRPTTRKRRDLARGRPTAAAWFPALARLVGRDRASCDTTVLDEHAGDSWFASRRPDAVVFAESTADVARTLRFASQRKIPVTARGAGCGYVGGCVPSKGGIVVSTSRMNRILEIDPADGVAVVEPAVITGNLQATVRAQGLFYPPDPASLDKCFIGGNIATNAGGPRCLKYGVTRQYVLGLDVVLADGSPIRVGGRTLKNKTGFDLVGLFVGSEGTLGIVTRAILRLLPHPPARAVLSAVFPDGAAAGAAAMAVFARGVLPSALEIADRFTLDAARKRFGAGTVPPGDAHMLLQFDGLPEAVAAECRCSREALEATGATSIESANDEERCEQLWTLRREFSPSLKATGLKKLNEDIVVPRGRIADLFAFAESLQKKYGMAVACFGHAGDGNIHTNVMYDPADKRSAAKTDRVLDELFAQVLAWGGAITGEHGIGLAKKRWWQNALGPRVRRLHGQIKAALDPSGILNPGKFV